MDDLKKYVYIKNILSKDERDMLFNYAKMYNAQNKYYFDPQTDLLETCKYGDTLTDSLLASKKKKIEQASNLKLIETYSYWRLYKKFSDLKKHTDRNSCEVTVSVTVKSDLKDWPLFIDGEKIIIKPGDGVLYFGNKLKHWREEYLGDYSFQIFFHYVLANGKFTDHKWDKRELLGIDKNAI
tara:strand:- start:267 stop:812 length:546 start_codon:yes stop_codon:yes gene_type:complete